MKLAQRTPDRVSHRRADLVRRRTVYETNNPIIEEIDGDTFVEFTRDVNLELMSKKRSTETVVGHNPALLL